MQPDATKAAHYIQALDAARVEGNWGAVPEFVRKIRKHAPERACLTLTAEVEHSISTTSKTQTTTAADRPSTALTAQDLDASGQLPKLLSAIENEDKYPEDKYQAKVCAGWLHWTVTEFSLAAVRLPADLGTELNRPEGSAHKLSQWTLVCALKAAYLKADCLRVNDQKAEALTVFEKALPTLNDVWTEKSAGKQLRYCAELFLTEFCMLQSRALQSNEKSLEEPNSLGCFRSWATYWASQSGGILGGHGFRGSVPRRRVWSEYYLALSSILDRDLPLPSGHLDSSLSTERTARAQLRAELKKVEAAYENLLIWETKFPRADEEREEVESFVKTVMKNWSILCGRGWLEDDLGAGGRDGLTRSVMDLLYRAATKTYHSTSILRSLFTTHIAVAEFDLAFKAFDSYLDLVKHGKARVDKTGHIEVGLDDDGTVLETISLCILALCRFGGRESIERARDLGGELEDWMARLPQLKAGISADGSSLPELEETTSVLHPEISPSIVALSWQAIGLSQAHWARVTFDASSRTEIQSKALRCLRKAVSPELGRSRDVRSLFALGLLLAERRELSSAIDIVKNALMSNKSTEDEPTHYHGPYWQERCLIPLWHLLALLLSARQDFAMAVRSCEGAFEQFKDITVLFGNTDQAFKSDHLNELEAANEKGPDPRRGVVDEMEDFEREAILEVKMTQLSLLEVLEGPDVAVNSSLELLSLFSRLFGDVQPKEPNLKPNDGSEVPRSSAGTLRSIKGSIFGNRSDRSSARMSKVPNNVPENETQASATTTRPATMQTTNSVAPTIQVTGENGNTTERRPSRKLSSSRRGRSESGRRNSLRKRDSSGSRQRAPSAGPAASGPTSPTVVDGETFFTPVSEVQQSDVVGSPGANRRQPPVSAFTRGTLSHLDSYVSTASKSSAYSYSEITADATFSITTPLPIIQFCGDFQRKQRTAILIKVWLMIAGFYRRAEMYEDGHGAVIEAQKLVDGLEAEGFATDGSSYKGYGWGETKTVEELWADVYAELGHFAMAQEAGFEARSQFETALVYWPDHPSATVGLSNILLDIYTEKLSPPPTVPSLEETEDSLDTLTLVPANDMPLISSPPEGLATVPIGLGGTGEKMSHSSGVMRDGGIHKPVTEQVDYKKLPAPYKATSMPLFDRLAARDRASGLLTNLTKLGTAWDYSEAWFALARAHEESGMTARAKEVLWWCVELEEGRGVREWHCLGGGGYIL